MRPTGQGLVSWCRCASLAASGTATSNDVGPAAPRPVDYVSRREAHLPPPRRTRYRGALRPWSVTDPTSGETRQFRIAYIWSSEEQASVADARGRAVQRAEEALTKVRHGLGGRHYKTTAQVDTKIAQILQGPAAELLNVRTGERGGKPTLAWSTDKAAMAAASATDGI